MKPAFKIPRSVLVLIHSGDGQFLLIERAGEPGFWQSVTGSVESHDEPLVGCCRREVFEETGIDASPDRFLDLCQTNEYEIYPRYRHRYAPGITRNVEHVFALQVDPSTPIRLAPREHMDHAWLGADQAAARCFSPSNAEAIRRWAVRLGGSVPSCTAVGAAGGPAAISPRKPL